MVGCKDALSELLLPPVDIRVQLVAVLTNRELLIVVDGDVDAASAHRLVLRVVELGNVGVAKGLVCRQTPVGVELQQAAQQVQRIVGGRWKQVTEAARLRGWQRLQHGRSKWAIDCFDVLT